MVSRPIPIVAEIVSILAGASPMRWGRMLVATLVGSVAAALLYGVTGATAVNLDNPLLTALVVLGVAGIFWLASRRLRRGPS